MLASLVAADSNIVTVFAHQSGKFLHMGLGRDKRVGSAVENKIGYPRQTVDEMEGRDVFERLFNGARLIPERTVKCTGQVISFGVMKDRVAHGAVGDTGHRSAL